MLKNAIMMLILVSNIVSVLEILPIKNIIKDCWSRPNSITSRSNKKGLFKIQIINKYNNS